MFRTAVEPLIPLALLSVELEAVARRLRLTLEEWWDDPHVIRGALFTLGGTDFVVTHHEGDPPGTNVWVRKSGPVAPATRMSVLLDALGAGEEVVAYSTWGVGTDRSRIPPAWGRSSRKPVVSHQEFWEFFKKRPGMYVGRPSYEAVTAFLNGYDIAVGGALLDGFREWLADRADTGSNLVWEALAIRMILPGGYPKAWDEDTTQHAISGLFALIDEFFDLPPVKTSPTP